jgi:hypothetical protein
MTMISNKDDISLQHSTEFIMDENSESRK